MVVKGARLLVAKNHGCEPHRPRCAGNILQRLLKSTRHVSVFLSEQEDKRQPSTYFLKSLSFIVVPNNPILFHFAVSETPIGSTKSLTVVLPFLMINMM